MASPTFSEAVIKFTSLPFIASSVFHQKGVVEGKFSMSLIGRVFSLAQIICSMIAIPLSAIAFLIDLIRTREFSECVGTMFGAIAFHTIMVLPASILGVIAPSKAYIGCVDCVLDIT